MIGEFDTVFAEEGELKPMKGEPMKIHLKKDVVIMAIPVVEISNQGYKIRKIFA